MSSSTLPPAFGTRLGAAALTVLAAAGFTCLAAPSAVAVGEAGDIRIHREHVPTGVSKDDPVACRFYLDAANFADLRSVNYTIKAKPPTDGTATVTGTIDLTQGAGHTDPLGLAEGSYTLSWDLPSATGGTVPSTTVKIFKINCREEGRSGGNQGANRPITDDGREVGAANGQGGGGQNGAGQNGAGQNGAGQNATALGAGTGSREGGRSESTGRETGAQSGANTQSGGAWNGEKGGPEGGVHAGGGGLADTSQAFTPLAATAAVGLVAVGGVAYFRLTRRRNHGAA
ncbi:hypothetical protein P1S61_10420 [Streptomyces sp. ME08-AFT2]|uniref:hypothetical protein n=1 Tax=Streptomyces sp. ME08-AFT2 TaxID=3028683 RepID=UPI0029A03487|nr:hypothetical protein [Streptomyces sp. ME08-AFT2]MDX3309504.1 hypothetical protein [Streptomyces sp. ME08-AFT2]